MDRGQRVHELGPPPGEGRVAPALSECGRDPVASAERELVERDRIGVERDRHARLQGAYAPMPILPTQGAEPVLEAAERQEAAAADRCVAAQDIGERDRRRLLHLAKAVLPPQRRRAVGKAMPRRTWWTSADDDEVRSVVMRQVPANEIRG